MTLASFVVILWGLSNEAPLHLFGQDIAIPGYLVWGALIYALLGTALTHLIGRPLVGLNFQQQRYEADFRFNLVRTRENAEPIALLRGEPAERTRLLSRFALVVENWRGIMSRTKRLTAFTASYSQAAVIFPYVLVAPAYFADKIQLGGMMQTASAFGSVQESLSFFISSYRSLAEWQSVVQRLERLRGVDRKRRHALASTATFCTSKPTTGERSTWKSSWSACPGGAPLVSADSFSIRGNARTLVTGPSGAGKSTLFRAIAGIWPFWSGTIAIPADAKLMMLPQRPYFPIGPLAAAVVYPAAADAFSPEQVKEVLAAVGLERLESQLEQEAHWNQQLSLGEQQRLGLARALLHAPQYLFLDEATASLDEASEARLYRLLQQRLPATTIVSIGHRSTLDAFHQDNVVLTREGDSFTLSTARKTPRPNERRRAVRASAAAMAGGTASGARHRQTASAAARLRARARTGTTSRGRWRPPAAD